MTRGCSRSSSSLVVDMPATTYPPARAARAAILMGLRICSPSVFCEAITAITASLAACPSLTSPARTQTCPFLGSPCDARGRSQLPLLVHVRGKLAVEAIPVDFEAALAPVSADRRDYLFIGQAVLRTASDRRQADQLRTNFARQNKHENVQNRGKEKPAVSTVSGGRTWDRTTDLPRVKRALSR